jgi:hypothetical protein
MSHFLTAKCRILPSLFVLLFVAFPRSASAEGNLASNNPPAIPIATSQQPRFDEELRPLELQISEFFINSPCPGDKDQYIEIVGTPRTTLNRAQKPGEYTYCLVLLENLRERAGQVNNIVQFNDVVLNDQGYAWFYGAHGEEFPAETRYRYPGTFDDRGGTLLLIAVPFNRPLPALNHNYDATTNDIAYLGGDWDLQWIVLDGVGLFCEKQNVATGGTLYAPVNFAAGSFDTITTPLDAVNVNTDIYDGDHERGAFELITYVGRRSHIKWFAANLTDSGPLWSNAKRNYAIAADDEHSGEPQCIDQRGRVLFEALEEITVGLGELGPDCGCGRRNMRPSASARKQITVPAPILADINATSKSSNANSAHDTARESESSLIVPR